MSTETATFGSGRREAHDATAFYDRFVPPTVSSDSDVEPPKETDVLYAHDARDMRHVASSSVALVVTSPPYFAGKAYEADLAADGVPSDYLEYLGLLQAVFCECERVLEPGGRIAVNVANLGRRPYRSLSGDVTGILQEIGFLLRGEVVWWKGRAAGGSCAWGTFAHPANPVLRDVTERVVIASKGRFDRALGPGERAEAAMPSEATITRDEFLEATTDLWEIAPESATRVGHPAPFPVELPQRLIELYTYRGDVILDPFMGSGSAAVAAVRTDRRFVGYDLDGSYLDTARERVAAELNRSTSATEAPSADDARMLSAKAAALALLEAARFDDVRSEVKARGLGVTVSFTGTDRHGRSWVFDVSGGFTTTTRSGLRDTDTLWRQIAKAAVLVGSSLGERLVLLSTDVPAPSSSAGRALAAVVGHDRLVEGVVDLTDPEALARLCALVEGADALST